MSLDGLKRGLMGWAVALAVLAMAEVAARGLWGGPHPPIVARMPDGSSDLFIREGGTITPRYQQNQGEGPISVAPPEDRDRIVFLGGSSLRGGNPNMDREHEMARTVGRALGAEAVNLAGPGLDTGHVVALLDDVVALQPDLVVVYTGHNDLGNVVFTHRYSDGRTIHIAQARALLGRSRLFSLLEALIRGREVFWIPQPGTEGRYQVSAQQRRVIAQRYDERLRRIVHTLRQADIPVVLSTVVSNAASPSLEWSCPDALSALGYPHVAPSAIPIHDLDPTALTAQQAIHPGCRDLRWLRARLDADQDPPTGMEELDLLRDTDPLPLRADRATVERIRVIAREEGASLADADAAFRAAGGGLEPPAWFDDFVHLSEDGHAALAAVIAPVAAQALGEPTPELPMPQVAPFSWLDCGGVRCRR